MPDVTINSKTLSEHKQLYRKNDGLKINRCFTKKDIHPFNEIDWTKHSSSITNIKGEVVFEQKNVEVPKDWSLLATNVVASKYFRGNIGTDKRENSVKVIIDRVINTIIKWAKKDNYFSNSESLEIFSHELTFLLVNQYMSFNSPVWFNVGIEKEPQCSACFINSVEDTMDSIMNLSKTEAMLFKYGSGTGTNFSPLRGKNEYLEGGGSASGPVSFMKGYDTFAGVVKSGGKTRRAAKMVMLDIDHPDIEEFINCKSNEEKKAHVLIEAGYDSSIDGEAYGTVFFQNANHSVRVSNDFMNAVKNDSDWKTINRRDGSIGPVYKARDLMKQLAKNAYLCGDPGLQFDTTINKWHTCKSTDRIYASNPCSEYMFLNDTACNLASLNLLKFYNKKTHEFDIKKFKYAVNITLTAQEILVSNAKYPTPKIKKNSHTYRPLGLGYTNLGALLMCRSLPYDSPEGRAYAASITALMCGESYLQSTKIASFKGAFEGYKNNSKAMLDVMNMHHKAISDIDKKHVPQELLDEIQSVWDNVLKMGKEVGFRNSQTTVLAPTGTISFMMDCDTTGIEPDISLIKYKKLVGGGILKIINKTVPLALSQLNYTEDEKKAILDFLDKEETIQGAPYLKKEHLPIFDCAFKPKNGDRVIKPMGHVKMMQVTQPFLSGAISKTINIPTHTSEQDIYDIYCKSWEMGLKSISIYRDGSKCSQPLNTSKQTITSTQKTPIRKRLPLERHAITHKFSIAGHEGYITVGLYEDKTPGEVFITMSKEGSTISGLMDSLATSVSLALQYGVPIDVLTNKFSHTRYEPSGFTGNPEIPLAKSITDYLFRWMALKFSNSQSNILSPILSTKTAQPKSNSPIYVAQTDSPNCATCGSIMVRNGACYKCDNCGAVSGCS